MDLYHSTRPSSCFAVAALVILLLSSVLIPSCYARPSPTTIPFITSSCSKASYPVLCLSSLSPYSSTIQSSPTQLVRVALSLSLSSAQFTSTIFRNMSTGQEAKSRELPAVSDCILIMGDAVTQLEKAFKEMAKFGGTGVRLQMGNVQTWVSTALTEESSCKDGFDASSVDGKVKLKTMRQIAKAVQLTCTTLSFVNELAKIVSTGKETLRN